MREVPEKAPDDIDEDELFGDVIDIEEFKRLDEKEVAKNRKVDWDAVLEDVLKLRKPFNTTYLRKLAVSRAYGDERITLYHSELTRVIDKWDRDQHLEVLTRVRKADKRRFYLVRRIG